ncbi:MAG: V-type ATP synthase subunit E [Chloroflexota bacterium]
MSLQAILESIHAAGEAQLQEIERETQAQVGEILARARMEADQVEEDARAASNAPAARERARIIHHARLEALRLIGTVREELVDAALAQARERLAAIRASACYADVLHHLTLEALKELTAPGREERAVLVADPRDRTILEGILAGNNLDLRVRYDLDCWGGLAARSEDGRVVAINTLESRLERATPFLRGYLAALFEEEYPGARLVEMPGK